MPSSSTAPVAAPGRYLTFRLADELYGLEVLRVQEIVGPLPVTRVPRLPSFVAGVVNLRGRVIPVVNLRLVFGLPDMEMHERTCIVVVRVEHANGAAAVMGLLVDEVSDVLDLAEAAIEAAPEFGASVDTSFIQGIGRSGERVLLLLDVDQALSATQLGAVEAAAREAQPASDLRTRGDE